MPKRILALILVFLSLNFALAQYGDRYNYGKNFKEFALMAGPVFFQSDYGARNDFGNYLNNNGFGATLAVYFTPSDDNEAIKKHFKYRVDLNYMKATLQHYGQYVDPSKNSLFAVQLRGMRGSTTALGVGLQLEYFPLQTDDYLFRGNGFSPFISIGGQINSYTATATSTLGPLGTSTTTPDKYKNAYRNETQVVGSFSAGFGTRYKLGNSDALIVDVRFQYYLTDWVDGLNPNRTIYTENQSNDWMTFINFGYVYYLE